MKSLTRRVALAAFAIACLSLSGCDKTGKLVTVTYQQLGNAHSWGFDGKLGGTSSQMLHVYMLRGVVNQGKQAAPFTFRLDKVALKNGSTIQNSTPVMVAAEGNKLIGKLIMPVSFTAQVPAGSAYTVPYGGGVLFFIPEEEDTDQNAYTTLTYKSATGESVLMTPLDSTAKPAFGYLDTDFIQALHVKQNEYENSYTPDGVKH